MSAPATPADDLLTLLPLPTVLVVRGEEVSLSKLRLRQISAALFAAEPLLPSLSLLAGNFTPEALFALLEDRLASGEIRRAVAQLLALCSDRDTRFYLRLKESELAQAGAVCILLNAAVFEPKKPSSATQKKKLRRRKTPPSPETKKSGTGLADAIQLLLKNGHSLEQILNYDLDQLRAYEAAAIRCEKRQRAAFVTDVALAVGALFAKKPAEALKTITREIEDG